VSAVARDLQALVDRTVAGLGYEVVDVERAGGGVLRVTIDVPAGITVDDCERVSHQLTHLFAVEGVDYVRLEVSSPGLDRPLKKANDYARFTGAEVMVQLHAPRDGRRKLHARLLGIEGAAGTEHVKLALIEAPADAGTKGGARRARPLRVSAAGAGKERAVEPQIVEVALSDIDRARLVPVLDFRSGQR
jgi:ribosome maturation factor RimP